MNAALFAAFASSRLDLEIPPIVTRSLHWGPREPTILDDPFVTREQVLDYLDGKKFQPNEAAYAVGPAQWVMLKREQIDDLVMTSDDPRKLSLRFAVNDHQRRYLVEASVAVSHYDSPELHFHAYENFRARVIREQ